jgi:hypothetical protein
MASVRVRFSFEFHPGACFHGFLSAPAIIIEPRSLTSLSRVLFRAGFFWEHDFFADFQVLHARANCSPENSAPERNPGLKRTRIGAIFKKFILKATFKSKIKHNSESFKLQIYPMKPSAGPFQSRENIPLTILNIVHIHWVLQCKLR